MSDKPKRGKWNKWFNKNSRGGKGVKCNNKQRIVIKLPLKKFLIED